MSDHSKKPTVPEKLRSFGWMAEYTDENALLVASRKVRDSGYTKTDAYTPFPVHGIDEALGIKPTILPFIVLCMGLTGLSTAIVMQYWMNGIDYPYIISGKPMGSWPAFIPVTFELTILFSAFTTFLGMWALNGLPRFSNPVFTSARFDRATNDRFFLHVDSRDKYFNRESVKELLAGTNPESLEEVMEDSTPSKLPLGIWLTVVALITGALIPAAIVANMRASTDENPRWHVFFDMDFQPKKKAQQQTTLFTDGRTNRPQVLGTIARGQLTEEDPFYLGFDPKKVASNVVATTKRLVSAQEGSGAEGEKPAEEPKPADEPKKEEPKPEDDSKKPADDKPADDKPASEDKPAADKPKEEMKEESKEGDKPAEEKPAEKPEEKPADKPAEAKEDKPAPAKEEPKDKPADAPKASDAKPAADAATSGATPPAAAPAGLNLPWVTEIPLEVNEENIALGKKKFEIYCSACHGFAGDGDGLVHRRADQLQQGQWLPPTSMHEQRIRDQAVGNIFYTISNGKGKMANYATVLSPKERWAVVMYVRALQRSRNASIEDVPVEMRAKIEEAKKAD